MQKLYESVKLAFKLQYLTKKKDNKNPRGWYIGNQGKQLDSIWGHKSEIADSQIESKLFDSLFDQQYSMMKNKRTDKVKFINSLVKHFEWEKESEVIEEVILIAYVINEIKRSIYLC